MHPRNIYKDLPNFKELAINYPEFRQHVKIDLAGKAHLDFHNPQALAALTKTLLKKDFNLDVEIPCDKLIPTLPLRLNYILWIEDLLSAVKYSAPVKGIDIGTGPCCIYPLLAVKKGWHMLATEVNATSMETARRNIEKNSLSDFVTLQMVGEKSLLLKGVLAEEKNYTFCMCNPPFFSLKEKPKNRSSIRKPPKHACTGVGEEIETEGGEISFIKRIIKDSLLLQDKVLIYTTLVGKLCNLKSLKKELIDSGVKNIVTTVFEQGKTMRWGLAWSFAVVFPSVIEKKKKKKAKAKPPVCYTLPDGTILEEAIARMKELFIALKVTFEVEDSDPFTSNVSAFEDTWSNQRRKRRSNLQTTPEKRRKTGELSETANMEEIIEVKPNKSGNEVGDPVTKLLGEPALEIRNKDPETSKKFNAEESLQKIIEGNGNAGPSRREPILEFTLKMFKAENRVSVEATWLAGRSGKEGMHQILQYFKNNWVSTSC